VLKSFAELLAGSSESIGDGVDGPVEAGGKILIGGAFEILGLKKKRGFIIESGKGGKKELVAFPMKEKGKGIKQSGSSGF